jgi:hypothetical protein
VTYLNSYRVFLLVAACIAISDVWRPASAQSESVRELREARSFFALPLELDVDRGAANGNAAILRIMPLYTFPLGDNWKLVNMTILTFADAPGTPVFPGEPGGGKVTGAADILHSSFFTPSRSGNFIWGIGPVLSLPTATDPALGSEKWSLGPAFRLTYTAKKWNLGVIAGQRWSFAGTSNRDDVNQLVIRGAIRRSLPNDWYFTSAPLIVANWNVEGEKWSVPLGGGFGRTFRVGGYPWAWSVQGYYNVIKPDAAPDWFARFAIVSAIPFGEE